MSRRVSFRTILRTAADFKSSKWFAIWIACLLVGGFIVLTSEVRESLASEAELIGTIDKVVLDFLVRHRDHSVNTSAIDITAMGSSVVLATLTLLLCAYFFFTRQFHLVSHLLLSAVGAAGLTQLLKFYFERSRPDVSLRLVDVQGFSYPSGHSLASAAIYFTIGVVVCKPIRKTFARMMLGGLFLGLIALIGVSRIYLGVHYFSDVLAGILIGIAWASLVEFIMWHVPGRSE